MNLYYNPTRLLLFVHGTESMSKARFIFLSLLPNVIFGFIPFVIFMINPVFIWLGTFGIMSIAMGFGDYINVFNAICSDIARWRDKKTLKQVFGG